MEVQEWLKEFALGYGDLSEQERRAIMDFAILWSFFESQVLENHASAKAICCRTRRWRDAGLLRDEEFMPFLEYFVERYVDKDTLNQRFAHLKLRNNDKPELVKRVLLAGVTGKEVSVDEVVAAMLIIVYRYRNNLFHGLKWAYNLEGQLDNFNKANQLLIKVLEITSNVRGQHRYASDAHL